MTPRMLILFAALASASAQTGSVGIQDCLPVSGERILAGDMARAAPAFAAIAPEVALGYAPAPGARRTYGAAELARLARRYGLVVEPGTEACFVRPLKTLTRERVAAALRAAMPAASIEVVEFSRQPIPPGELHFPVSGLPADQAARAPLLWHGVVSASGQDDFPVWAKVRIQISEKRVTAIETLAPGRPIERAQLREEPYEGPPGLPDLAQVVGRVPRRPIPAGAAIELQWLGAPADVVRGDVVRVEIRSGQARVLLEGQAQSSGRRGEVIGVRNPANGKILRATVADRGHVVVAADRGEIAPAEGEQR
ncbi:MAG: flagellar basal body P-ring formation chaperone FlgA [Bryobacteraceae bacterium]|jgi:flagella basal body P-ring formation protein FlgA